MRATHREHRHLQPRLLRLNRRPNRIT
jgi:hypothetical protein